MNKQTHEQPKLSQVKKAVFLCHNGKAILLIQDKKKGWFVGARNDHGQKPPKLSEVKHCIQWEGPFDTAKGARVKVYEL